MIDKNGRKQKLVDYLDAIVGKHLYKKDQWELCKAMNIRCNGVLMKSSYVILYCLQELELNYLLRDELQDTRKFIDGVRNPNRNKWYWVVYRLSDTPVPKPEKKPVEFYEREITFLPSGMAIED